MKEEKKKVGALRFTKVWNWDIYRKHDDREVEIQVRDDVRVRLKKWIREHFTDEEPLTEIFDVYAVYEVIDCKPQTMTTVSLKLRASVVNNKLVMLEMFKKKIRKMEPQAFFKAIV